MFDTVNCFARADAVFIIGKSLLQIQYTIKRVGCQEGVGERKNSPTSIEVGLIFAFRGYLALKS